MKLFRSKTALVLAIILAASGWGWHRQRELQQHRAELALAQSELSKRQQAKEAATQELEAIRQQIYHERLQRDEARLTLIQVERASARRDGESKQREADAQWNQPPQTTAEWNAASPYVWLRKDTIDRLKVRVLMGDGSLSTDICTLLDINSDAREAISGELRRMLKEWRATEVAVATLSNEHLPQMRPNKGEPVTVQIPQQPELTTKLRQEFDRLLLQKLGEQRAHLFSNYAQDRLADVLGSSASAATQPEPKIYSVQRDGNVFNIAIHTSISSMNTRATDWRSNIPEHLHSLFAEELESR